MSLKKKRKKLNKRRRRSDMYLVVILCIAASHKDPIIYYSLSLCASALVTRDTQDHDRHVTRLKEKIKLLFYNGERNFF